MKLHPYPIQYRDSATHADSRSFAERQAERLRHAKALGQVKSEPPYGYMCRDPQLCAGKGYCPRDPTCGD